MFPAIQSCSARTYRIARSIRATAISCSLCTRRSYGELTIQENDVVLLVKKGDNSTNPMMTKPLRHSRKMQTHVGQINHSDIIGKSIRDILPTKKGDWRIQRPSLADYIINTPRIVTPIYPRDANLIVSLLDLHPEQPSDTAPASPPLEIFEAGTGHGALTLYLARAIHAANPLASPLPFADPATEATSETDAAEDTSAAALELEARQEAYNTYLPTRRAIIHTLDINAKYQKHARSIVRNFRHGMYYPDVDFHLGTINDYIESRLAASPEPFLQHAILDLPGCHKFLEALEPALKVDGTLLVFCPSITQINACVQLIRDKKMPYLLETTLETGSAGGSGGKEWDVRPVKPRALLKAEEVNGVAGEIESMEAKLAELGPNGVVSETIVDDGWEMVCRPKVGERTFGGGFVAVFRRMCSY